MLSILLFTAASLLCGMALTMPMLIVARVLQGVGGGGMQPLAQSILLESFPPRKHGTAMAVYGMGIVVAPIIGPTLGGWITDSYSWRWIFYINLPIGILALFMVNLFVEDPPYLRKANSRAPSTISASASWPSGWAPCSWCWTRARRRTGSPPPGCAGSAAVSRCRARRLHRCASSTDRDPIVQLRVFADRNFGVGTLITGLLRLRSLRHHGHAAAVSANHDGLFGAAERPGRQPARHRRHGSPWWWWDCWSVTSMAAC